MDTPPRRKANRLRNFDYASDGAYFITICSYRRACIFGSIDDGVFAASRIGLIVENHWREIPERHLGASLGPFVVMPNHLHGVLVISKKGTMNRAPTIGEMVRSFKARTTFELRRRGLAGRDPVWQRNYYEHVVRNEADLNRVQQYIIDNPLNWDVDEENVGSRERAR